MTAGASVGFWRTAWLLLKTARRRSQGRQRRQRALLNNRSGDGATNWGGIGTLFAIAVMAVLHGLGADAVITAVETSQRFEVERQGKIVVSDAFLYEVRRDEAARQSGIEGDDEATQPDYAGEAEKIAHRDDVNEAATEQELRNSVGVLGSGGLVARRDVEPGLANLPLAGPLGTIVGSMVLVWWFAMVACQGEGLELDLQRRRHPMWEWLLSHPVGAGGVFLAEMLSPISANPTYWTAPLFAGVLYGAAQGWLIGITAVFLIGIPMTVAAACLGKAIEIGAILRLPVRSRGALIGILSWFGYASMLSMFFGSTIIPFVERTLSGVIPSGAANWLLLQFALGQNAAGEFSLLRGIVFWWVICGVFIAGSVVFSARSIRNGLSGAFASDSLPGRRANRARDGVGKFGRDPLFRKEYLWFVRDRSAIVQAFLIPLTVAAFQMFNMRILVQYAEDSWNYLSGAAVFFGTYFLWVLGPKSLTSEGSALWIALTWPRGLESVLRAKAWLWSMISSALVVSILLAACWMFPDQSWKIALVGVGWFLFSRSMAQKSVTLVTVVSESGEAEKIPSGRRWAAQLGMLTFAIGIVTEQWNLAIVGIVYSWITAAAMWENLTARLPYLYDPWSETLPPPPTLMHAMVAISIMVECAAIITAILLGFGGKEVLGAAQTIGYAVCAVGVSIGMSNFLSERGVDPVQIWCWRDAPSDEQPEESLIHRFVAANWQDVRWLAYGVGGGVLLGVAAHFYLEAIALVPAIGDTIQASRDQFAKIPELTFWYAVMAIGFAPFAEEYLFRGLLFRTLDRRWGGLKAVIGAAAFFAIYHPPTAWLPVAMVGATNCILFKKSKRLAPAILLHMTYNTVVTLWM